jgi:hypothetical protein
LSLPVTVIRTCPQLQAADFVIFGFELLDIASCGNDRFTAFDIKMYAMEL